MAVDSIHTFTHTQTQVHEHRHTHSHMHTCRQVNTSMHPHTHCYSSPLSSPSAAAGASPFHAAHLQDLFTASPPIDTATTHNSTSYTDVHNGMQTVLATLHYNVTQACSECRNAVQTVLAGVCVCVCVGMTPPPTVSVLHCSPLKWIPPPPSLSWLPPPLDSEYLPNYTQRDTQGHTDTQTNMCTCTQDTYNP